MIRKSVKRFSERSCPNKKLKRDDDLSKSHRPLVNQTGRSSQCRGVGDFGLAALVRISAFCQLRDSGFCKSAWLPRRRGNNKFESAYRGRLGLLRIYAHPFHVIGLMLKWD